MQGSFLRKSALVAGLFAAAGAFTFMPNMVTPAFGQTNISGDVVGTVTDPSGAVIPGAKVTLKSVASGATSVTTTNASGSYRFNLLKPGQYTVSATGQGFETSTLTLTIATGQIASGDIKLTLGQGTQTVEVTGTESLLHTESAQISTNFQMEQIQSLPNPGNDLTFVAQTSPGAVMNTQAGYGNFSVFGLPGTSNTFTINGGYENDPFLNISNSGATNLLLGNNDISEVTVIANPYDASFGGLGGAQVNEISRSGSNQFHGNATYWWNGRVMNANSWFNKNAGSPRSFDNVNQWAAAIGGPIKKDKTFFFVNYEGLRVVLPTRATVYAPSQQYETKALATIPAAEVPLYNKIFSFYNNAPGYKSATPVDDSVTNPDGSVTPATGDFVQFNGTAGNFTHEYLVTGRIDQVIGASDRLFGHVKVDKGVQATFTSLLDPVFNVASGQPQYEGQLNETHIFSPNLTNQFLFAASYYRAIFSNANQAKGNAQVPFSLVFLGGILGQNGYGGFVGGENFDFPQGRNVTGYQFEDDVNWINGNHTVKFGWSMRRDDVTDYTPSVRAITPEAYSTDAAFQSGYLTRYRQSFPSRNTQPVAVINMGWYIQDAWKAKPNLTLTYGLRFEHNGNPICVTNCFADLASNFLNVAGSTTTATPYNQMIVAGRHQAFHDLQFLALEPRFGFAYSPFGVGSHTTVRGGFGMYADTFPAQIASDLLTNAPGNVQFYLRGKYLVDPTLAGSGGQAVASSNQAFVSGYKGGASFDSLTAQGIGFTAPAFTTADRTIKYPTYEEWSLALEQQVAPNTVISATYVGNHGLHEPVVNGGINAYGFDTLPATAPSGSFGQVSEVYSGASSNYNGVVVTAQHRDKYTTVQLNYTYSHALDEISNGGFDPFGESNATDSVNPANPYDLHQNYGNADYDIRHYISGSYVVNIPYTRGPRVITGGWQVSGTVFHNTGLPFTYIDSTTPNNYLGSIYGQQTGRGFSVKCDGEKAAGVTAVPCASAGNFAPATAFGQQRRNQLRGPNYTDTDLDLMKSFGIPRWESAHLKVGAQLFNVFNHPNFGLPINDVESPQIGTIQNTVSTPTSVLGSFLGGDASPRLIQLKAEFQF